MIKSVSEGQTQGISRIMHTVCDFLLGKGHQTILPYSSGLLYRHWDIWLYDYPLSSHATMYDMGAWTFTRK